MTTPDASNVPRGGRGRFRRQPANVERDARACRLAAQGWTYEQIAGELGYADRGTAWRAVQRVMIETARAQGTEELRVQQLAELAELRKAMWRTVDSPPPLVDKLGRPVHDDSGEVVPDEQARAAAAQVIIRAGERAARLRGLDAARRTVGVTFTLADVEGRLVELRRELGLDDDAGAPRAVLPGAVESA